MSDDAVTPPTRMRPGAPGSDQRRVPRGEPVEPPPGRRTVPTRLVLLGGLIVLLLLAAWRAGGVGPVGAVVSAVVGVPLAVVLPGAVLQPRFLPGLHTDVVTRWCLRAAVALGFWALVVLAVGAAGVPVGSVWPVVVGVVLLAAVVVGEPERERRFGRTSARQAVVGVLVVVLASGVAVAGRGLVALGGAVPSTSTGGATGVVTGFADSTVPVSLAATGARASTAVVVSNPGGHEVHLTVRGQVGRALPWPDVAVGLPAGATRTITLAGPVPVCADPQQLVVNVYGGGAVPPLAVVLSGAAGGVTCGTR